MKHQKKKKSGRRKKRKQQRKSSDPAMKKWLSTSKEKWLKEVSKMVSKPYRGADINKKFFCNRCLRSFCINFEGGKSYCDECHWNGGCYKKIFGVVQACTAEIEEN